MGQQQGLFYLLWCEAASYRATEFCEHCARYTIIRLLDSDRGGGIMCSYKPTALLHLSSELLARINCSVQKGKKFMFLNLSVRGKEKVRWQWMIQNIKREGEGIGRNTVELERKKMRPLCWKSIQFEGRYRRWLCRHGGRL